MSMRSVSYAMMAAIALALGAATAAHAVKPQIPVTPAVADHQKPPDDVAQTPEEPKECIADKSGFRTVGKVSGYLIVLENSCTQRHRCKVSANVMTSRGSKQANATLTLGPVANGQPARQTHMIDVGALGGMASSSRACQPI